MPTDARHYRKYSELARSGFYEPVVETARAYLAVAVEDPRRSQGDGWALSCLPGTTPWRLSAVTMRTMDMLVVNRPRGAEQDVQAIVVLERSTLRAALADAPADPPGVQIVASDYHEAGPDQALIRGPWRRVVDALDEPAVIEAVRSLSERIIARGRTLHWRGHNQLLVDDVLGR
jgi:hypothetical protein